MRGTTPLDAAAVDSLAGNVVGAGIATELDFALPVS